LWFGSWSLYLLYIKRRLHDQQIMLHFLREKSFNARSAAALVIALLLLSFFFLFALSTIFELDRYSARLPR